MPRSERRTPLKHERNSLETPGTIPKTIETVRKKLETIAKLIYSILPDL